MERKRLLKELSHWSEDFRRETRPGKVFSRHVLGLGHWNVGSSKDFSPEPHELEGQRLPKSFQVPASSVWKNFFWIVDFFFLILWSYFLSTLGEGLSFREIFIFLSIGYVWLMRVFKQPSLGSWSFDFLD